MELHVVLRMIKHPSFNSGALMVDLKPLYGNGVISFPILIEDAKTNISPGVVRMRRYSSPDQLYFSSRAAGME